MELKLLSATNIVSNHNIIEMNILLRITNNLIQITISQLRYVSQSILNLLNGASTGWRLEYCGAIWRTLMLLIQILNVTFSTKR